MTEDENFPDFQLFQLFTPFCTLRETLQIPRSQSSFLVPGEHFSVKVVKFRLALYKNLGPRLGVYIYTTWGGFQKWKIPSFLKFRPPDPKWTPFGLCFISIFGIFTKVQISNIFDARLPFFLKRMFHFHRFFVCIFVVFYIRKA